MKFIVYASIALLKSSNGNFLYSKMIFLFNCERVKDLKVKMNDNVMHTKENEWME